MILFKIKENDHFSCKRKERQGRGWGRSLSFKERKTQIERKYQILKTKKKE